MKYKIIVDSVFIQNYDKIGINFTLLDTFSDINGRTLYIIELTEFDFNLLENKSSNWDEELGCWYWDNGLAYPWATYFSIKLKDREIKLYYQEYLLLDFVQHNIDFLKYKDNSSIDDYWPIDYSDDFYKEHKKELLEKYVNSQLPFTGFSDYCYKMFRNTFLWNIGKLIFANAVLNNISPEELTKLFKN